MRYDDRREVYRDCRWCQGRGCLYCKAEADKAYKAAFPDGPQLVASFENNDQGMEKLRTFIQGIIPSKTGKDPENGGAA